LYVSSTKTQAGKRVKKLLSDGGGEYIGAEVKKYLIKKGIKQELSPPDTPQVNGKSERINRTLENMIRSMLNDSNAPRFLWGEALRYAIYIRNRLRSKKGRRTRYEIFHNIKKQPRLRVHVFGSLVYYKNNSRTRRN
jgi:transposase InsO family protein